MKAEQENKKLLANQSQEEIDKNTSDLGDDANDQDSLDFGSFAVLDIKELNDNNLLDLNDQTRILEVAKA